MAHYEIRKKRTAVLRKWRWNVILVADNGEILSTSEALNSDLTAMENIESQKAVAPTAEVRRVER